MTEDEITSLEMIKFGAVTLFRLVVIVAILCLVLLTVGSTLPWIVGFLGYCWSTSAEAASEFFKNIV